MFHLLFEGCNDAYRTVGDWKYPIPVRCMALYPDFGKKGDECTMIQSIEGRGHESSVSSETRHKIFIGEGIGQIAAAAAGRFELGGDFREFFTEKYFLTRSCRRDSGHNSGCSGTDYDYIIRKF